MELKVTELRKQASPNDIVHKGKTFKLKSKPCGPGIELYYMLEKDIPTEVPEPFRSLLERESIVAYEHVELKWWEKVFGVTLKSKAMRGVKRLKKQVIGRLEVVDSVGGV